MGRKRVHDRGLPKRVYRRRGKFYYVSPDGIWHPLGATEPEMYRNLADIRTQKPEEGAIMEHLMNRYQEEVLSRKAPITQRDQRAQINRLLQVFGKMHPNQITKAHVRQYLRQHTRPTTANREVAVLSHFFTTLIDWDIAKDNPCAGVRRNPEKRGEHYINDEEYVAVRDCAPRLLCLLMDLAYLTGQRQGDLVKLKRSQLTEKGIHFKQSKTGAEIEVQWSHALRSVVAALLSLTPKGVVPIYVVSQANGGPYSSSGIQTMWQRHMNDCVAKGLVEKKWTFRDIRAKARSDAEDKRLLGHTNPEKMARTYQRKAVPVKPVQ